MTWRLLCSALFLFFFLPSVQAAQLQVGAFRNPENVQQRTDQLESMGYDVRHQQTAGQLTRIRTANLNGDSLADLRHKLDERGINYRVIGGEPDPEPPSDGDTVSVSLPGDLPRISGYRRSLSDTLLERLNSVMGTEYTWGGETPSKGFDCSGLLHWLFREDPPRTVATLWPWTKTVERENLQPGDFVFFTFESYEEPDHIGLYLGNGEFVHASSSYGVIKADLDKNYYQQNLYGYGRPTF